MIISNYRGYFNFKPKCYNLQFSLQQNIALSIIQQPFKIYIIFMKNIRFSFLIVICLFYYNNVYSQTFEYTSPKNNSILVSLKTNIILRSGKFIDESSLSSEKFLVKGNKSGLHYGVVKLSDDNKTILFIPDKQFEPDENVDVIVNKGIKSTDGTEFLTLQFSFKTTPLSHPINADNILQNNNGYSNSKSNFKQFRQNEINSITSDSLPADFPTITVKNVNDPADGKIFISNASTAANTTFGSYLMILNNDGSVVNYKELPRTSVLFKMEANGQLSYNLQADGTRIMLDTSLTPVDTFVCGNGYLGNGHGFALLPNGHALMIARDPEPYDMSKVVPGGNVNAIVRGAVVQELDIAKNVVFQWRTWDYLPITASYYDLTSNNIDLVHANAIAADNDGNILLSLRHMSAIIKIDRNTGDLDWILGGKLNQFTFYNENENNSPDYFSYQHSLQVLPNGNILTFDNGNQHSPQYSRGVEYKLDEKNKTATLVWEYRHDPDIYGHSMGSVQRLSNGNSIICWGQAAGKNTPVFTEIHPDKTTALELFIPAGFAYSVHKYLWVSQVPETAININQLNEGSTYSFNTDTDSTGIMIKLITLDANTGANLTVTKYNYAPLKPEFSSNAPILNPYYFKIEGNEINSYNGEVHINLQNYSLISPFGGIVIYGCEQGGQLFIPIPTSYDSSNHEVVFNTTFFGKFAFGIPQTISANQPVPYTPANNETVNGTAPVILNWRTIGVGQYYELQIASDPEFNNLVVDSSNITSNVFTTDVLSNNSEYYWRVNAGNQAGTSEWSDTLRFLTASPYIKILSPNGQETVITDSTYVIRWQTNAPDALNIELLHNYNVISVIGDSVISATSAYAWKVSSSLQQDSLYKIKITSISDPNLTSVSEHTFTIKDQLSGVKEMNAVVNHFKLLQNYPNPFNPTTKIQYSIPKESFVKIKVYDVLGKEIATLVNGKKSTGNYSINFDGINIPSGIYFYRMQAVPVDRQAGSFISTKKFILLK